MTADQRESTIVVVDNVDIDNSLAALAACRSVLELNARAVIVTGRFANSDRTALIDEQDPSYSKEVLRRNTRRLQGLLDRAGLDVPVFEGEIPLATIVPHRVHIDETLLDLHNDMRTGCHTGSMADAIEFLVGLEGVLNFVVGGPLTEIASIMRERRLQSRLGRLTCQLGLFGFGNVETMAGGGLTFNSAADPEATKAVLAEWPAGLYMVPTDVTKMPAVGFDTPEDLRDFGVIDELVRLYEIFWGEALKPRGERIYPHDVHAVFLMAQLCGGLSRDLYAISEVRIDKVGPKGQINATFDNPSPLYKRFVATNVDATAFMNLLRTTVC